MQTVSQFVSIVGVAIKPSLTTLIPALLVAAGELESTGLSHLSVRFGANSQNQEIIDNTRAILTKSHYTTQTVTKVCVYIFKLFNFIGFSVCLLWMWT